jgi:hypothetical protein
MSKTPSRRPASALVALAALTYAITACTGGSTGNASAPLVRHVQIRPGPNSVLSVVVTVETSAPAQVSIVATGGAGRVETPADAFATHHSIPLVGLRQESTYSVTVSAVDKAGHTGVAAPRHAHTGSLPADLPSLAVTSQPARMAPGVTMFDVLHRVTNAAGTKGYAIAVDAEGEVVWYYETDHEITDIGTTKEGTLLLLLDDSIVREIDILGNTVREYASRSAESHLTDSDAGAIPLPIDSTHHEISQLPNGDLLTISTELLTLSSADATQLCPENPSTAVAADIVVEFTSAGEVAHEWHIRDLFDPMTQPGTEMCTTAVPGGPPTTIYPQVPDLRDWTHTNAATVDVHDNALVISLRHLDTIVAVRYAGDASGAAGALLWEFGKYGTLQLLNGEWPSHQHAPEMHDDNTILMYDNGNGRVGTPTVGSRAVEYQIDPDAKTVRQIWEHRDTTTQGAPVLSLFLGDADQLSNGNVLVTNGAAGGYGGTLNGRVVEVDRNAATGDGTVFDMTVGGGSAGSWLVYRAERFPTLLFAGRDLPDS